RKVQRRVLVVQTRLGPHDGALDMAGDLDPLADLGLPLVGLVTHHDVDALYAWSKLRDLGQLLVEVGTESIRDLHVTSGDDNLHGVLHGFRRVRVRGAAQPPSTA